MMSDNTFFLISLLTTSVFAFISGLIIGLAVNSGV